MVVRNDSLAISYRIHIFFSLKIINPKNRDKNIVEISDQNRINIKVTHLYFFNQSAKNTK